MSRKLDADEWALWAKVAATVTPLHPKAPPSPVPAPLAAPAPPPRSNAGPRKFVAASPVIAAAAPVRAHAITETLDASWDRRLTSGRIVPDHVIDLHGHTVEAARHLLYRRVLAAEAHGARVLLVITGKGGRPGPAPVDLMPGLGGDAARRRGAIRAELPRWLGEEILSARIAAVRRAHPRHGGAGAVYIILKRRRDQV
ncbi:MAG: Smr/MutS family protein [Sphingomonadaceae bacterium]